MRFSIQSEKFRPKFQTNSNKLNAIHSFECDFHEAIKRNLMRYSCALFIFSLNENFTCKFSPALPHLHSLREYILTRESN